MTRHMISVRSYVHNRRLKIRRNWAVWLILALVPLTAWLYWWVGQSPNPIAPLAPLAPLAVSKPGDILGEEGFKPYTLAETVALAHEDYGNAASGVTTAVTKITFRYRSELPSGEFITEYGRAYLPESPRTNLPVFAFAPGTTGIGDECAPSLEQPKVANWANYDSHMAMYAGHGFAAVTPDYEGFRDPSRIHHYMVGELEGRSLLDAVRALRNLPEARGRLSGSDTFLAGYSQGGHSAYWADKVAAQYAPDVKPKGVIGFGPVMSVKQTLTDVTHGANINWFGPYVLYSYSDYYGTGYPGVLLPHWEQTLAKDVPAHCIDTDLSYWGHKPADVYTPEFLKAATDGTLADTFTKLSADLDRNEVGTDSSSSAKLINAGAMDNVLLPTQQASAASQLCHSSLGPVEYKSYPTATHYTTMTQSFSDTVDWMRTLIRGQTTKSSC